MIRFIINKKFIDKRNILNKPYLRIKSKVTLFNLPINEECRKTEGLGDGDLKNLFEEDIFVPLK